MNASMEWIRFKHSETPVEFAEEYICAKKGYRTRILPSHSLPKEECWILRIKDLESTVPLEKNSE